MSCPHLADPTPSPSEGLTGLSVRELIAELAQVEETLCQLPGLLAEADAAIPTSAIPDSARPLRQRELAIVHELTARRHERGLIAAPLVPERGPHRTSPPWS